MKPIKTYETVCNSTFISGVKCILGQHSFKKSVNVSCPCFCYFFCFCTVASAIIYVEFTSNSTSCTCKRMYHLTTCRTLILGLELPLVTVRRTIPPLTRSEIRYKHLLLILLWTAKNVKHWRLFQHALQ